MRTALRPLMLLLAAAFGMVLTAGQAGAYYELPQNRRVSEPTEQEAKLRQLAAENEHLRNELQAERERSCKVREKLDELRMQLVQLRGALQVCQKVTRQKAEMARKPDKPEVAASPQASKAPVKPKKEKPGLLVWFLQNNARGRLRRLFENIFGVLGERPRLGSTGPSSKVNRPAPSTEGERGETFRKYVKAIKSRLKKALEEKPAAVNVRPQSAPSKKAPAPQIPQELKDEMRGKLREKLYKHLKERVDELRRPAPARTRKKVCRSAWF